MQHIDAAPDGLASDGQGLQSAPNAGTSPAGCQPAGVDPVSAAVATSFSVWESGLAALVAHSHAVRVVGGLAVQRTGAVLDGTDLAGGQTIATLGTAQAAAPDATLPTGGIPDVPVLAAAPPVPSVPEPTTGDAWSAQIHGGPGSGPLRSLGSRLRATGAEIKKLAEETRSHGHAIDAHWDDGIQKAGTNVGRLADWFDETSRYAEHVATAAERSAEHVDQAISGTPRPEVFTELRERVNKGMQRFTRSGGIDVVPLQAATADMAEAQRKAVEEQVTYALAANTTTSDVPHPPAPAPPIAGAPATGDRDPQGPPPKPDDKGHDEPRSPKKDGEKGVGEDDKPGAGDTIRPINIASTLHDEPSSTNTGPANPPASAPPAAPAAGTAPAPTPPQPAVPDQMAAAPANAAGNALGTVLGGLTQAASGAAPSQGGGGSGSSPMSALSSLSGLGSGMPSSPEMSSAPSPDPGGDFSSGDAMDFGPGSTSASGGGGAGGGGGGPALPAAPTSLPAASITGPTIGSAPAPAGGAAPGVSAGMGGGMYPPMAGGMGGNNNAGDRDKDLHPDKRVVHREVPNTEPVFGELERERRRPPRTRGTQEEEPDGNRRPR